MFENQERLRKNIEAMKNQADSKLVKRYLSDMDAEEGAGGGERERERDRSVLTLFKTS